jgi:NAD(P)H-flavin reductase
MIYPLGNTFSLPEKDNVLLVGGGCGDLIKLEFEFLLSILTIALEEASKVIVAIHFETADQKIHLDRLGLYHEFLIHDIFKPIDFKNIVCFF